MGRTRQAVNFRQIYETARKNLKEVIGKTLSSSSSSGNEPGKNFELLGEGVTQVAETQNKPLSLVERLSVNERPYFGNITGQRIFSLIISQIGFEGGTVSGSDVIFTADQLLQAAKLNRGAENNFTVLANELLKIEFLAEVMVEKEILGDKKEYFYQRLLNGSPAMVFGENGELERIRFRFNQEVIHSLGAGGLVYAKISTKIAQEVLIPQAVYLYELLAYRAFPINQKNRKQSVEVEMGVANIIKSFKIPDNGKVSLVHDTSDLTEMLKGWVAMLNKAPSCWFSVELKKIKSGAYVTGYSFVIKSKEIVAQAPVNKAEPKGPAPVKEIKNRVPKKRSVVSAEAENRFAKENPGLWDRLGNDGENA